MTKVYTLSEVVEHKSPKDCWLIIDGKVYDVTRFLKEHPGGDELILAATGRDTTSDFEDVGHSKNARKIMSEFEIGEIEASSIPKKLTPVDPNSEPKYNPDKTGEFIMKILQILVPMAILALAVASRFLNLKEAFIPAL